MLAAEDLYKIGRSRFNEAKVLAANGEPDGAVYLCGYALEMILKRRIVELLKWSEGYPETRKEFENLRTFKTHDLDLLLKLGGLEDDLKSDTVMYAKWQKASSWNSEFRYRKIGTIKEVEAVSIIESNREVINWILERIREIS